MAPSLVVSLLSRLPEDSLTLALMRGGAEHRGWGMDRHMLASLVDAMHENTIVSGEWKKGKTPKLVPFPRPKENTKPKKAAKHVDIFEAFAKKFGAGAPTVETG